MRDPRRAETRSRRRSLWLLRLLEVVRSLSLIVFGVLGTLAYQRYLDQQAEGEAPSLMPLLFGLAVGALIVGVQVAISRAGR